MRQFVVASVLVLFSIASILATGQIGILKSMQLSSGSKSLLLQIFGSKFSLSFGMFFYSELDQTFDPSVYNYIAVLDDLVHELQLSPEFDEDRGRVTVQSSAVQSLSWSEILSIPSDSPHLILVGVDDLEVSVVDGRAIL